LENNSTSKQTEQTSPKSKQKKTNRTGREGEIRERERGLIQSEQTDPKKKTTTKTLIQSLHQQNNLNKRAITITHSSKINKTVPKENETEPRAGRERERDREGGERGLTRVRNVRVGRDSLGRHGGGLLRVRVGRERKARR
jgi:hypothetical protein